MGDVDRGRKGGNVSLWGGVGSGACDSCSEVAKGTVADKQIPFAPALPVNSGGGFDHKGVVGLRASATARGTLPGRFLLRERQRVPCGILLRCARDTGSQGRNAGPVVVSDVSGAIASVGAFQSRGTAAPGPDPSTTLVIWERVVKVRDDGASAILCGPVLSRFCQGGDRLRQPCRAPNLDVRGVATERPKSAMTSSRSSAGDISPMAMIPATVICSYPFIT